MTDITAILPLALLAAFLVGMSKGGLPAIGMLAVPMLAFYIDPLTAAALLLPIYLVSDAYGIWLYRSSHSARNLAILIPAGLLGVTIGYLAAPYMSVRVMNAIVGLIGLSFCLLRWFGKGRDRPAKPAAMAPGLFWGTLAGITSFVSHAGAPPYQVYVLPQKLPKLAFAGTTTITFAAINFAKLPPYLALGLFPQFQPGPIAILCLAAIAGAWSGSRLTKIVPDWLFFRIVEIALFVMSIQLLYRAI